MKTVPVLTFLVALVGFLTLPVSFELAASALFATGFFAIALADYGRRDRLLRLPEVAAAVTARRSERLGLAA
jgi:hypothetical protein